MSREREAWDRLRAVVDGASWVDEMNGVADNAEDAQRQADMILVDAMVERYEKLREALAALIEEPTDEP